MKLPSFNPYLGNNTQPMGLSRYLDGLLTNMGTLLLCNLYFLLCCIPIITIGPSLLALNKVCTMLVRGKSVHATRDFFDAFRKNFKAGIVITFTVVPVLLWNAYMMLVYLLIYLQTGEGMLHCCLFLFMYIFVSTFSMYLISLLVHLKANFYTTLRNTVLCCMIGKGSTIFGGISTAVLILDGPLCLPASVPLLLLIYFSFVMYHVGFFSWKVMDKHIFAPYYEEHPEEAEADGYC